MHSAGTWSRGGPGACCAPQSSRSGLLCCRCNAAHSTAGDEPITARGVVAVTAAASPRQQLAEGSFCRPAMICESTDSKTSVLYGYDLLCLNINFVEYCSRASHVQPTYRCFVFALPCGCKQCMCKLTALYYGSFASPQQVKLLAIVNRTGKFLSDR